MPAGLPGQGSLFPCTYLVSCNLQARPVGERMLFPYMMKTLRLREINNLSKIVSLLIGEIEI